MTICDNCDRRNDGAEMAWVIVSIYLLLPVVLGLYICVKCYLCSLFRSRYVCMCIPLLHSLFVRLFFASATLLHWLRPIVRASVNPCPMSYFYRLTVGSDELSELDVGDVIVIVIRTMPKKHWKNHVMHPRQKNLKRGSCSFSLATITVLKTPPRLNIRHCSRV